MPQLSSSGWTNYRVLESFRAKLSDWAVRPVRAGRYSWAALSLIDSKTMYSTQLKGEYYRADGVDGPQEMEIN